MALRPQPSRVHPACFWRPAIHGRTARRSRSRTGGLAALAAARSQPLHARWRGLLLRLLLRRRFSNLLHDGLGLGLLGALAQADEPKPDSAGVEFFEKKIRPILVERCYECHSTGKKRKGGLLLDSRAGMLKGGDTGPAIVPGDPAKSLLIQAIGYQG